MKRRRVSAGRAREFFGSVVLGDDEIRYAELRCRVQRACLPKSCRGADKLRLGLLIGLGGDPGGNSTGTL